MKKGDKFTVAGIGRGRKGQLIVDGINIKTKRKCKAIKRVVFTVKEVK